MTHKCIQKRMTGTKWVRRVPEMKTRLIQFLNRTMAELIRAMDRLKERYHRKVSLSKIKLVKGLYTGYITVA